jgi:high-affinity iron transporter
MVNDAKHLGASASQGSKTLWALTIAVALSVLREGAETVLFVAGLVSGTTQETSAMLIPIGSGLLLGAATGWLMYAGLARIKSKSLFSVTNTLILLLAGSLASQLAKILSQANVLTILTDQVWDSSHFLPNNSSIGMLLHGLIGYDASPSQLQLLFYVCTTGFIWLATQQMKAHVHAQHTH